MSEKHKNDQGAVEWSFDFARVGESFNKLVDSFAGEEDVQTSTFSAPKQDTENARININFSIGKGNLTALPAGSATVFDATVKHVGEIEFIDVTDKDTHNITLRQKAKVNSLGKPVKQGFRALANHEDLDWNLAITQDMPVSLDVHGGVGPVKLDLAGTDLRRLKVNSGLGTMTVVLPKQDSHLDVDMNSGVGMTKIYIPENADLTLELDAGVGAVEVTVAPGTAVQLKADGGIGSINVPQSLNRLTKKKEFMDAGGVWQSEGYDLAKRRVTIKYDGGVGSFHLREAELV